MADTILLNNCSFAFSFDAFSEDTFLKLSNKNPEVILLSYNAFENIDLESEMDGTGDLLASLTRASLESSSTVFCGVTTQILGVKHISVAVCHKGRLVDIVDRTSNLFGDEYETSEKIKIYATDTMRIAVLVDTDILVPKNWEKIISNCDLVLCILKGSSEAIMQAAVKSARVFSECPFIILDELSIEWSEEKQNH